MLEIPEFETLAEKIDFLITNKSTLLAQKTNSIKFADAFMAADFVAQDGLTAVKAGSIGSPEELLAKDSFRAELVINTTNIMDSHKDVHLKGLWKKSLKENKRIMHIQEHEASKFSSIISDGEDLKAYTKTMTWKELGYDMEGSTQALIFDSVIKQERNPYMFEQYAKGYVNNHSVGMRYVKMDLAVNDERYEKEYAIWQKYIGEVVNAGEAEKAGYFFAVHEAKAFEGSAVPLGSNHITPTLSIKSKPSKDTQTAKELEAAKALQAKKNYFINLSNH